LENFNDVLKITQEEIEKSVGTIYSVHCRLQLQGVSKVPGFFFVAWKIQEIVLDKIARDSYPCNKWSITRFRKKFATSNHRGFKGH
jgi:hypothetical protein